MKATVTGPDATGRLRSFISGMGERATLEDLTQLRIGTTLRLRRAARPSRGCAVEILTETGKPLGWLPREDEVALATLCADVAALPARVAGIVPAFQRPRVQVEILLPGAAIIVPAA